MKYTKEELENMVVGTNNCYEVLEKMGVSLSPGNFTYWKSKINSYGIDISHWKVVKTYKQNKTSSEILCENQDIRFRISSKLLKKHLVQSGVKYECKKCGISQWDNQPITLQIDHINGDWKDNRPTNLRFLCPNCHSQTSTYCGRKSKQYYFCECGKEIQKTRQRCRKCYNDYISKHGKPSLKKHKDNFCVCGKKINHQSKSCIKCYKLLFKGELKQSDINYQNISKCPKKEELEELIWEQPTVHIAKKYGVTDKAVEKWCKKYNIAKPPRGYWAKQKSNK